MRIPRYGYALSAVQLIARVDVTSVTFDIGRGSLAGGVVVTARGFGFSSVCRNNRALFNVDFSGKKIFATEYVRCSNEVLVLKTPSVLSVYPTLASTYRARTSELAYNLNNVTFSVNETATTDVRSNRYTVSQFKLNDGSSTAFNFALASTPLVIINATSGFANSRINALIFSKNEMNQSTVSISIGAQTCYSLSPQDTSHIPKVQNYAGSGLHFYADNCNVPPLAATTTAYPVLVNIQPHGYAITNTSVFVTVPQYTSLFKANKVHHYNLNSSVLGGMNVTITGAGFSKATTVTVCEKVCSIVKHSVTYGSLECTLPARLTSAAIDLMPSDRVSIDLIANLTGTYFRYVMFSVCQM